MPPILGALLGLDRDRDDMLERFVSERLFEAGVWPSARTSDGICYLRAIKDEEDSAQVCGLIYDIDQMLHAFWVDVVAGASPGELDWRLWFELDGRWAQKPRNAIDLAGDADDLEWEVALTGTVAMHI